MTDQQLSLAAARGEGEKGATAALEKVEREQMPTFGERALAHIRDRMREGVAAGAQFQMSGEALVDSAKAAGITPAEDRAFGAIFAKAIREHVIRPVGYCGRAKGNGTAGGRLYAPGDALCGGRTA